MTMENDQEATPEIVAWATANFYRPSTDKAFFELMAILECRRRKTQTRIQALEAELAAALIEVSNQARLRGEAEGKLHVSELAGIVEGWQNRAERAEAELATANSLLKTKREFIDAKVSEWERAEAELAEAWNEAQCCDDTPLGQATLAEFIADQHKCRKSAEAELARKTEALEDARHEVWNLGLVVGQIAKWPRTYFNRFYVEEWAIRTAYILSRWDNGTSRALDVLNVTSQRTKPNKRLAEEARLRAARSALEEKIDV